MKIVNKIFSYFLNILMVLVIIILFIAIYSFFQINVFNKPYVNLFGYTVLQVKTGSMENTINVGDIVIVKILDKDDKIEKQDIVTYKEDKALITHRIIDISEDTVITKGDANNTEDSPIQRKQIIGKVKKTIPNVRIWIQVFKTKSVYRLMLITIVLMIITFSIKTKNSEPINEINVEENDEKKD